MAGPQPTVYATTKSKAGRLTRLVPGPSLSDQSAQDALVARARIETATVHGTVAVNRVLFAERNLTGSFAWRDKLRIYRCLEGSPVGSGLNWVTGSMDESPEGPPYPFMLQVNIEKSPNPFIQSSRTLRELDTYQHLLTLLVSGHIRGVDRAGQRVWVSVHRDSRLENHLLYQGFTLGDGPQATGSSAPVFGGDDYYNHLWGSDSEILLPPSLDADLSLFASLERDAAQSLRRAAFWYSLGLLNRGESALSTVAFSTATECLLSRNARPRCHACGSQTGAGPTRLFKAHLARYGTLPEGLPTQRAALYGVRSSLVHGTYAPSVDTDRFSHTGNTRTHDLLLELVTRRSLLNWLRDPRRMTWHREPILPSGSTEHDEPTHSAVLPQDDDDADSGSTSLTEKFFSRTHQ